MGQESQEKQSVVHVTGEIEAVREQDKIMLVLCYLSLLSLIPLLTVKDSDYVQWHAKNGLVLGLGVGVVLSLLWGILLTIPVLGWLTGCTLWVGWIGVNIVAMRKALRGERWRVPVVSDLAAKL